MKKIFATYLGSLGDTFLIIPTLRAIKEIYPSSKTIFLISPATRGIMEYNPYVDDIIYYQKGDNVFPIFKKIWRADLTLMFDPNYRMSWLSWLAGIPNRIGFAAKRNRFLTIQCEKVSSPNFYEAQIHLGLARIAGIDTKDLSLYISPCLPEEKTFIDEFLAKHIPNNRFIAIAPYSGHRLKDWPEEYYNELIDYFQKTGYAAILIGGNELKQNAEKFRNAFYMEEKINPRQSAYIISLAKIFICGCTFSLHLASTTQTPILAMYGPTSEKQWAPYPNCTTIARDLPCRPCKYYIKDFVCKDNQCMRKITSDEVIEKAVYILNLQK